HPLEVVANNTSNQSRLLLMGLLSTFVRARGPKQLKANARPIVIFEDPESRLHPTLLNQAWRLINLMPMQKILTTNSSNLLSSVPLTSIRRLERGSTTTETFQVPPDHLSKNDQRKVSFHVRFHRPSALFARCWLLVEGETEVWLFNELARIQGYDLSAEGVQLIEFAQSGLKPLIKLAGALGIEWHVIADGDFAGQKYANTARSFLNSGQEKHRLTVLPDRDIEHYLFNNGYEPLFREMAHIEGNNPHVPAKKIIAKALKKYAKPDAALAIIEYTEKHLDDAIPLLLRWTLQRVISMARGAG
ncbi:ATP-dependent endonuclease, partial [Enterovibrio nigricans]